MRPGECEYQSQFETVFNSGVLKGSNLYSFREYKVIEDQDEGTNAFIDIVIR